MSTEFPVTFSRSWSPTRQAGLQAGLQCRTPDFAPARIYVKHRSQNLPSCHNPVSELSVVNERWLLPSTLGDMLLLLIVILSFSNHIQGQQLHHQHLLKRHSGGPLGQILNYNFTTPEIQLRKVRTFSSSALILSFCTEKKEVGCAHTGLAFFLYASSPTFHWVHNHCIGHDWSCTRRADRPVDPLVNYTWLAGTRLSRLTDGPCTQFLNHSQLSVSSRAHSNDHTPPGIHHTRDWLTLAPTGDCDVRWEMWCMGMQERSSTLVLLGDRSRLDMDPAMTRWVLASRQLTQMAHLRWASMQCYKRCHSIVYSSSWNKIWLFVDSRGRVEGR